MYVMKHIKRCCDRLQFEMHEQGCGRYTGLDSNISNMTICAA